MKTHAQISLKAPEPATPEATRETSELLTRIDTGLQEITRISYNILLCGPRLNPPTPIAVKRQEIFETLKTIGHKPYYSENLPQPEDISRRSIHEVNAKAMDLLIVMVDIRVYKTIGEAHDLCGITELNPRMHLLIPNELNDEEDGDEIFQEYYAGGFGKLSWYKPEDIPACNVLTWVMEFVKAHQMRTYKYRASS